MKYSRRPKRSAYVGASRCQSLGGDADVNEKLNIALSHMTAALETLDSSSAPPEVGAHLDLAICRLNDIIEHNLGIDSGRPSWSATTESSEHPR